MLCRYVLDFRFLVMEKSWKDIVEKEWAPWLEVAAVGRLASYTQQLHVYLSITALTITLTLTLPIHKSGECTGIRFRCGFRICTRFMSFCCLSLRSSFPPLPKLKPIATSQMIAFVKFIASNILCSMLDKCLPVITVLVKMHASEF